MRRAISQSIRHLCAGAAFFGMACGLLIVPPAVGRAAASEPAREPPVAIAKMNTEQACAMIRSALHQLAEAERKQAFSLDLYSHGHGGSAMVQARLAILLDHSNRLRNALRVVHMSPVARDDEVKRCSAMGLHALAQAERLTTTVEEVLYGPNLGNPLPGATLRSDAAPTAPARPEH